jgi:serine O-acetyltransferase
MQTGHSSRETSVYAAAQMNALFPDGRTVEADYLDRFMDRALDRIDFCFRHINHPAYFADGSSRFDLLHSDQYCTFIYYLSNTIHREAGDPIVARKLFCLNKALHAFNCVYDTELPDILYLVHCIGTVLGKAQYSNYMVFCHNTTVGAIRGVFPTFGERVLFSAGASAIGRCHIGSNTVIGPGCSVIKTDIPDNTLVSGVAPAYVMKQNSDRPAAAYFRLNAARKEAA